jgi:hypothetical protein
MSHLKPGMMGHDVSVCNEQSQSINERKNSKINLFLERYCTADDSNEAIDRGLETAFVVLEKTRGLSYDDQVYIIN